MLNILIDRIGILDYLSAESSLENDEQIQQAHHCPLTRRSTSRETMVLQWIFPRNGGGWARRYLRYRQDIFRTSMEGDFFPCTPLTLFDFGRHDDAVDASQIQEKKSDGWRVSDDRVIGGFSEASATMIRTKDDYRRYLNGETIASMSAEQNPETDAEHTEDDDSKTESSGSDFTPFIRWEGSLDTTIGLRSDVQRSGFTAIRSPEFPFDGASLQGLYNALEITCRSDSRLYTVNLKVSSFIPDDVFQGHIRMSPTDPDMEEEEEDGLKFDKFVLPFTDFRLTAYGRERELSRELDDKIKIQSIGLTLMDGQDGDFIFDLARIRAVNMHEGAVFEGPPPEKSKTTVEDTASA
jgi:hypothetical protein